MYLKYELLNLVYPSSSLKQCINSIYMYIIELGIGIICHYFNIRASKIWFEFIILLQFLFFFICVLNHFVIIFLISRIFFLYDKGPYCMSHSCMQLGIWLWPSQQSPHLNGLLTIIFKAYHTIIFVCPTGRGLVIHRQKSIYKLG